jgi:hypothetical protein
MRPWMPRGLAPGSLAYIVVEELGESVASLVVAPWPAVDDRGRLRFGDEEDAVRVAVDRAELLATLARHRRPMPAIDVSTDVEQELVERPLAVGDVFGAAVQHLPSEDGELVADPKRWLEPPVFDLTAEVREFAKAQTNAAVAGVLTSDDVEAMVDESREDDEPPEPAGPGSPSGGGDLGGGEGGTGRPGPPPERPSGPRRPWLPPGLGSHLTPGQLDDVAYLVVDELQEGIAVVVVSPWPWLDERGRLRFGGEEESTRVVVPAEALEDTLRERRRSPVSPAAGPEAARELQDRALAIGDAFAGLPRYTPDEDGAFVKDPDSWLKGAIVDVSLAAREAAKAQQNAAVAGILTTDDLDEVAAEFREQEEPPPEPEDSGPQGTGGSGGSPLLPRRPAGGPSEGIDKGEEEEEVMEEAHAMESARLTSGH